MKIKPHPIMIKNYLARYFVLMIIPTVRGIITFFTTGTFTKTVAWYTAFVILIAAFSALRLLSYTLIISDNEIKASFGLFYRRELNIKFEKISGMSVNKGLFLHAFRAASVKINTEAGRGKKSDIEVIISEKNAALFEEKIYGKAERSAVFPASTWEICISAVSVTSFFASAALAVSVINSMSKIIADDITGKIYQGISDAAALFDFLLPRAVGVIAAVILLGFALSFVYTVSGYAHFRAVREYTKRGAVISMTAGLLAQRKFKTNEGSVKAAFVLSRPFMKVLRRSSLSICTAGFAKTGKDISVLYPAAKSTRVPALAGSIIPGVPYRPPGLKTPARYRERFIFPQTVILMLSPVCAYIASLFAGRYTDEIFIALAVGIAADALWLAAKCGCIKSSGIRFEKGMFCFCTLKGMTEVKGTVLQKYISALKISRSPFDRMHGLCSVSVRVLSEKSPQYKVRNLDFHKACEVIFSQDSKTKTAG